MLQYMRFGADVSGGQIVTSSERQERSIERLIIRYRNKGCSIALCTNCFNCPVEECYEVVFDIEDKKILRAARCG
jgi:hypothetical protein